MSFVSSLFSQNIRISPFYRGYSIRAELSRSTEKEIADFLDVTANGNHFFLNEGVVPPMFLARLSYPFLKKMIFNRSMGVNPLRLVHASQSISLIKPIILEAPLVLEAEVSEVDNCGHSPRFGIVTRFFVEGEAVAEALSGFVVRGKRNPGHNRSDKGPEQPLRELSIATDKNLSRRYARVSGDSNPIHTNSLVARMAGFKSPILQGLCTMSLVYSSLQEHFNVAPAVADHIECSFSSVVYPGEVLRLRIFKGGTGGHPFSLVNHEGREVLKNGIYVF